MRGIENDGSGSMLGVARMVRGVRRVVARRGAIGRRQMRAGARQARCHRANGSRRAYRAVGGAARARTVGGRFGVVAMALGAVGVLGGGVALAEEAKSAQTAADVVGRFVARGVEAAVLCADCGKADFWACVWCVSAAQWRA